MRRTDEHLGGVRWGGSFEVDRLGPWEYTIEAWTDVFGTWRDELERKVAGGQHDLAGEMSEGALLLGNAAESATATEDRRLIEHARRTLGDSDVPENAKHDVALGPELLAAVERGQQRDGHQTLPAPIRLEVDRRRARFGAWYELFPRSWGGLKGVEQQLPRLAELGFDVLYLPPIHPIGLTNRKGRDNSLIAGREDPGSPWAIGDPTGGHDAVHRDLGTIEDLRSLTATAARARRRHRARLRDPVLGRSPVAARAPRVVSPPPRRHAEVRREPAQALPGHLQRQLGLARLARPVAGAAGDRAAVGRLRRQGVPRRQPAHQAVRLLAVADRQGPRPRPRRRVPRRGVHPARGDAAPGEDRLQPVLHVLHLEELALGADRVRVRARLLRRAGVLPAQLLRQHPRHPARLPPARRAAGVRGAARAGRDAEPQLRDLLGL